MLIKNVCVCFVMFASLVRAIVIICCKRWDTPCPRSSGHIPLTAGQQISQWTIMAVSALDITLDGLLSLWIIPGARGCVFHIRRYLANIWLSLNPFPDSAANVRLPSASGLVSNPHGRCLLWSFHNFASVLQTNTRIILEASAYLPNPPEADIGIVGCNRKHADILWSTGLDHTPQWSTFWTLVFAP